MSEFGLRDVLRKSGAEPLQENGAASGIKLLDFWQWSSSDLLSNALRGRFAEFLVASALGVADGTRVEWDAIDLVSLTGIKVEVKSSAYLQSWKGKPSCISFDIGHKLAWEWERNSYTTSPARSADVYVFCLLDHHDPESVDPMNLNQWRFFVLATRDLESRLGQQKTMRLSTLQSLNPIEVRYAEVAEAVEQTASRCQILSAAANSSAIG